MLRVCSPKRPLAYSKQQARLCYGKPFDDNFILVREEEERSKSGQNCGQERATSSDPWDLVEDRSCSSSSVELLVGRVSVGFTVVWYPRTLPPGSQA